MVYWIVLSTHWALEDVQAGVNVLIQVLCILTIFCAVQFFWQTTALRIAEGKNVPVARVLSINTPGEVWDAIALLRLKIFRHASVFTQSVLVVVLGLTAIFAGPIARFNTHKGMASPERSVPGLMASRSFFCSSDATLRVQDIWQRLDKANFPHDRLLDWLPQLDVDWQFSEADWNSSWSAECDYKPETDLTLTGTGVHDGEENWPTKFFELDGLWNTLNNDYKNNGYLMTFWGGDKHDDTWLNVIFWIYAVIIDGDDMKMDLVSTYLYRPPPSNDTDYDVGEGPVQESYYTKASCNLKRKVHSDYQAFPDVEVDRACVAEQAATYFFASAITQGLDGIEIHLPTGQDIWRFFQSYEASKDTYHKHPNEREMEVRIPTVEISITFLVIASAVTLLVLLGLARYAWFQWRYHHVLTNVPETKVDWVLYSHRTKGRKGLQSMYGSNVELAPSRYSRQEDPWNVSRWSLNKLDTAYRPLNEPLDERARDTRWSLDRGNSDYQPLGNIEATYGYGGLGRADERSML